MSVVDDEKNVVQDYLNALLGGQSAPQPPVEDIPLQPEKPKVTNDETLTLMVFRRGVLQLGIPVSSLSGTQALDGFIQPLPRAPQWVLGKAVENTPIMLLIDCQALVMPGKTPLDPLAIQGNHLVSVMEGRMGLLADEVVGARKVNKNAVQWRQQPGSRPWLSGVVSDDRCIIIDPRHMMQMLL